jgi:hypothetical protein
MPSIMTEQDEEFFYELSLQLVYEHQALLNEELEEDFFADCVEEYDSDEDHFFMDIPGEQLELFPWYDLPF